MDYTTSAPAVRAQRNRSVFATLTRPIAAVAHWVVEAGHKDRECGRCGTIVRAGTRQCLLCSNDFDIR